jgi:predicted nucleotidyltransferase
MSFKKFVHHEKRKILQGDFKGNDFYIRCIKDWNEVDEKYGDLLYQSKGYAKIEALICDDTESIFTPCSYKIKDVTVREGAKVEQIKKIVSFRGRFCEQVKVGEKILAQGKIEKVISNNDIYHRLLIGNKTSDYIISI